MTTLRDVHPGAAFIWAQMQSVPWPVLSRAGMTPAGRDRGGIGREIGGDSGREMAREIAREIGCEIGREIGRELRKSCGEVRARSGEIAPRERRWLMPALGFSLNLCT